MLGQLYALELQNHLHPEAMVENYCEAFGTALQECRHKEAVMNVIRLAVEEAVLGDGDDKQHLMQWLKYLEKAEIYVLLQQIFRMTDEYLEMQKVQTLQAHPRPREINATICNMVFVRGPLEDLEQRQSLVETAGADDVLHATLVNAGGLLST
eukprot:5316068-Amphidinium_carterae.1